MNSTKTKALRPDWCFIGLDQTADWHLPAVLMQHVEKILTVCAFDRSSQTHCCEVTPSYWLECVCFSVVYKDGVPDRKRDDVENEIMAVPASESSCYMHARVVDRMMSTAAFSHVAGDIAPDEDEDERQRDAVFEYWNSNPKF